MRLTIIPLAGTAALIALGCSSGQAKTVAKTHAESQSGSTNPAEALDEARMADAIRGLRFAGGFVEVESSVRADAAGGERLRLEAERVTRQRNTWFISVGAFRDAILADPTNSKSFEGLARAMLLEGKTSYALDALKTCLRLAPNDKQARYTLGMVRQMGSDYLGAVAEWKALTAIDPTYRDVYGRLAIASYYAQDFPAARIYLRDADRLREPVPPQFRDLLKETEPKP